MQRAPNNNHYSSKSSSTKNNISNTSTREARVNSLLTVNRGSSKEERDNSNEREEVEALLSREDFYTSTDVIGLRVPLAYKIIYRKYIATSRSRLELFKKIVSSAIVMLAKQDSARLATLLAAPGQPQIVLNMNVNHVEQKVEQRVDVSIDASVLEEVVDELREIVRLLERTNVAYKPALRNYAKKLREVMARVNDVRRQLATN